MHYLLKEMLVCWYLREVSFAYPNSINEKGGGGIFLEPDHLEPNQKYMPWGELFILCFGLSFWIPKIWQHRRCWSIIPRTYYYNTHTKNTLFWYVFIICLFL